MQELPGIVHRGIARHISRCEKCHEREQNIRIIKENIAIYMQEKDSRQIRSNHADQPKERTKEGKSHHHETGTPVAAKGA